MVVYMYVFFISLHSFKTLRTLFLFCKQSQSSGAQSGSIVTRIYLDGINGFSHGIHSKCHPVIFYEFLMIDTLSYHIFGMKTM